MSEEKAEWFKVTSGELEFMWFGHCVPGDEGHVWLTNPKGEKLLQCLKSCVTPAQQDRPALDPNEVGNDV